MHVQGKKYRKGIRYKVQKGFEQASLERLSTRRTRKRGGGLSLFSRLIDPSRLPIHLLLSVVRSMEQELFKQSLGKLDKNASAGLTDEQSNSKGVNKPETFNRSGGATPEDKATTEAGSGDKSSRPPSALAQGLRG